MKLIIAMIQPHRLPEVKRCLDEAKVHKMTVSNVLGAGQQRGDAESYRGVRHETNLIKKVRIEIGVNDDFVKPTVDAIIKGARTGNVGDGKIFIVDLPECIRIRTGETGSTAIG